MRRLLLAAAIVMMMVQPSLAITAQLRQDSENDAVYYNQSSNGACGINGPGPGSLPAIVPEPYNGIFTQAARKFNTDLALLATIFWIEHGGGWPKDANGPWASSPSGAKGPFQFLDGTWKSEGQDGNNDGVKDVQNLSDAAYGAANYLSNLGGLRGTPPGSLSNPFQKGTIINVIRGYNAGPASTHMNGENTHYVNTAFPFYLQLRGGTSTDPNASPTTAESACGSLGVSADGFVFPQQTTKASLREGAEGGVWCSLNDSPPPDFKTSSNCHHDYNAADIANKTGTPVVAVRPGVVLSAHYGGSVGMSVRIYSDPKLGGDGKWYYFAHLRQSSEGAKGPNGGLNVSVGDTVKAGQQLGEVGTAEDAEGTFPHTHFDISPIPNGFNRGRPSSSFCPCPMQGVLINPEPVLQTAFERLPEK